MMIMCYINNKDNRDEMAKARGGSFKPKRITRTIVMRWKKQEEEASNQRE